MTMRIAATGMILSVGLMAAGARAAAPAPAHSRVDLLSAVTAFAPGEPFDVGLRFRVPPGWHTYWMNPGDAGMAPRLAWRLPAGFTAAAPDWPLPQRFEEGDLTAYGYAGEIVIPIRITPPREITPGAACTLVLDLEWLDCHEICVPGQATLRLTLAAAAQAAPGPDAARLKQAAAAVPAPLPAGRAAAARTDTSVRLTLSPPPARDGAGAIEFFPASAGWLTTAPARVEVREDAWVLHLARDPAGTPPPERLEGMLAWTAGGRRAGVRVDVFLQSADKAVDSSHKPRAIPFHGVEHRGNPKERSAE